MYIIKQFLTPNPYSRPQIPLKKVTKIALHYVGNAGSTAQGNRNYFNNLANTHTTYASSHYIIGLDGEIIQCIPENEWAYCTNDANSYSISIENCHPKTDGKFTDKTRQSLKELCTDLCKRYGLNPKTDLIRHYDVNGKCCPKYWVDHPDDFIKFKNEVYTYMKESEIDMEELNKLSARLTVLEEKVKAQEQGKEKVFDNINEIPDWGKTTVNKLVKKGVIQGTGTGLNISNTLLRLLVINDRAGVYDTF